jgi:hypothetical protein
MKQNQLVCFLSTLALAASSGCAVLTKTQTAAVHDFATQAKDYGTLPGEVVDAHHELRALRQRLDVTTVSDGAASWKYLTNAYSKTEALTEQANRADAALNILDSYAQLLVALSSDTFNDQLATAAERLSGSLNAAIGQYNKTFNKELPSPGSFLAAGVRGLGGIYIRCKQAKYLRDYVTRADTIVQNLTLDVQNLSRFYLSEGGAEDANSVEAELNGIMVTYTNIVNAAGGKVGIQQINHAWEAYATYNTAKDLAKAVDRSAAAYRSAHAELSKVVTRRATLKDRIQQIQTLADEIKAAQKLKRKLDE